jgi:nucleotidyltransferase/DNA polymerase involved in DNA repair
MGLLMSGVGYKLEAQLTAMGITTANDLRGLSCPALTKAFNERIGSYLYSVCRGEVPL